MLSRIEEFFSSWKGWAGTPESIKLARSDRYFKEID
jgi:hypothetical protein